MAKKIFRGGVNSLDTATIGRTEETVPVATIPEDSPTDAPAEEIVPAQPIPILIAISAPAMRVETIRGYALENVEVSLTSKQARALKSLTLGIQAQGKRLESGKLVGHQRDAIAWVLEQISTFVE